MTTQLHIESYNPATGESLGKIPQNRAKDIKESVDKIRIAQAAWADISFHDRGLHLRKMQRHLTEHGEEYAQIISQDNGKTLADACMTEISPAMVAFDYYIFGYIGFIKSVLNFFEQIFVIVRVICFADDGCHDPPPQLRRRGPQAPVGAPYAAVIPPPRASPVPPRGGQKNPKTAEILGFNALAVAGLHLP